MIIDHQLRFSNSQALTATAVSTNVIDLGYADADSGTGEQMFVVAHFETALGGTTPTFQIELQQSDDNSTYETILLSKEVSEAPADGLMVFSLPRHSGRYLRLNYTLGGTSPTVTISSGVVAGEQSWTARPDALTKIS